MKLLIQSQKQGVLIQNESVFYQEFLVKFFSFFIMFIIYEGRLLRRLNKGIQFLRKKVLGQISHNNNNKQFQTLILMGIAARQISFYF